MKREIKYIELKTGFDDNGPAWIAKVEYSKSGQTIYFNNKALKKIKKGGISGNYYDIETGDEYWISGVKKNGQDRHWTGSGKIMIDENIITEYLKLVDFNVLDNKLYDMIKIQKNFDKTRFNKVENSEI